MRVKLVMLAVAVLAVTQVAAAEDVFATSFVMHKNNTVMNESVNIIDANARLPAMEGGDYTYRMLADGRELVEFPMHFIFERRTMFGPDEEIDTVPVLVRIPYQQEATTVEILKHGMVLDTISLPERVCTADDHCPQYCQEQGVDLDCRNQGSGGPSPLIPIVLAGAVVALGVGGYVYDRRR